MVEAAAPAPTPESAHGRPGGLQSSVETADAAILLRQGKPALRQVAVAVEAVVAEPAVAASAASTFGNHYAVRNHQR